MFSSLLGSSIFNTISNFLNKPKQKNIIIDPMSCIIKLGILSFYPEGTKICITDNQMDYDFPTVYQGSVRFVKGDAHEDLHNLFNPICLFIKWYGDNQNKEIDLLFERAIIGLEQLQKTYIETSTINHTLNYYINTLKSKAIIKPNLTESTNEIHNFLKVLWNDREINIIIEMFKEFIDKKEKEDDILLGQECQNYLDSINNLTKIKEQKVHTFLNNHSSILV